MKEAAPDELAAVKRRALKSLAMGRIEESDCTYITSKIDDLTGFILNMHEEENE